MFLTQKFSAVAGFYDRAMAMIFPAVVLWHIALFVEHSPISPEHGVLRRVYRSLWNGCCRALSGTAHLPCGHLQSLGSGVIAVAQSTNSSFESHVLLYHPLGLVHLCN